MEQARISRIDDSTYRFTENAVGSDAYMYLLIGGEKALLIDTGFGFTDVPAAVRRLTSLPLTVVNTHGHMDHIHGNYLYPEVHMPEEDTEVFARHMDPGYLKALIEDIVSSAGLPADTLERPEMKVEGVLDCRMGRQVPLPKEMAFELGGRRIRILKTPGHTPGSISLLDEKNGWLFAGDTCCRDGVLLHFPEGSSVEHVLETIDMRKTAAADGQFNRIYPGHQITPLDPSILDLYERNCRAVLEGNLPQSVIDSGVYTFEDLAVRFDPHRIWEGKA